LLSLLRLPLGSRPASGPSIPAARKVERPPYEKLLAEIEATSYCAVGRKYGVSDNAVRKWMRWYEREREREMRKGVRERA
jgi:transposase-like protein